MTKRVSITLNDAQYRILRHYAGTLGLTDAYAARMCVLKDLLDWHAKVMKAEERPKTREEQDIAELDAEMA